VVATKPCRASTKNGCAGPNPGPADGGNGADNRSGPSRVTSLAETNARCPPHETAATASNALTEAHGDVSARVICVKFKMI
jgi:hypothetical protein